MAHGFPAMDSSYTHTGVASEHNRSLVTVLNPNLQLQRGSKGHPSLTNQRCSSNINPYDCPKNDAESRAMSRHDAEPWLPTNNRCEPFFVLGYQARMLAPVCAVEDPAQNNTNQPRAKHHETQALQTRDCRTFAQATFLVDFEAFQLFKVRSATHLAPRPGVEDERTVP